MQVSIAITGVGLEEKVSQPGPKKTSSTFCDAVVLKQIPLSPVWEMRLLGVSPRQGDTNKIAGANPNKPKISMFYEIRPWKGEQDKVVILILTPFLSSPRLDLSANASPYSSLPPYHPSTI